MPYSPQRKTELRAERYAEYLNLVDELGMEPQTRWIAHHQYLLNGEEFRRLTRAELFAFWRERLTDDEIREVGGALDSLLSEDEDLREVA